MSLNIYRKTILITTILFLSSFFIQVQGQSQGQNGFAIIIDGESYKEAKKEVNQYAKAIEKYSRLKTYIIHENVSHPDSIRNILKNLYLQKQNPIEGAVLIGDIPIPMVRDAQHMTSAFKMNQETWERRESSVPSDRFYDDFDLEFEFLGEDDELPYFYYSLTEKSSQYLSPEIYTGRIHPTDTYSYNPRGCKNGEKLVISKYDKLRNYLKKATEWKENMHQLNYFLFFGGHGYISDCMVAKMDEKIELYEHFPWFERQDNGISFIDHSQDDYIKFRLMNELMRDNLDMAVVHHHGNYDTEYLSNIPKSLIPEDAKKYVIDYCKSKLRSWSKRKMTKEEATKKLCERFDIPASWFDNAFDPKVMEADSIENAKLDLHLEDFTFYDYKPNCRLVVIDACYCGAFNNEDCIANEYIFSKGKTIACVANTVNVLQDKWANKYIGLLGLGMPVGEIASTSHYLESHVIGDPTFSFTPIYSNKNNSNNSKKNSSNSSYLKALEKKLPKIDFQKIRHTDNYSYLKKTLHKFAKKEVYADVQAYIIEKLYYANQISSQELLNIFKSSPFAIVRLQSLLYIVNYNDENMIKLLSLASKDRNEMVQRQAVKFIGKSGNTKLIPALIALSISNNTSDRTNFNAGSALSMFPQKDLLSEFHKQFDQENIKYLDKTKVEKEIEKAIINNSNKWVEYINLIIDKDTPIKKKLTYIRFLRNYCPHYRIPDLLTYLKECYDAKQEILLIEALGWRNYSYMKPTIIETMTEIINDSNYSEDVHKEALKTIRRLSKN